MLEVSLPPIHSGTPDVFQVVEFVNQRGYKVYDICGFLRRPLDDALSQIDLAFAKANGRLCDNRWREGVRGAGDRSQKTEVREQRSEERRQRIPNFRLRYALFAHALDSETDSWFLSSDVRPLSSDLFIFSPANLPLLKS